jgi:SAM-dependent methyltransferase
VKFDEHDQRYFKERLDFARNNNSPDMWKLIDHWPLYVGKVNLARNLAITDLLKSTLNVPGDVVEFGCWKGSTSLLLAKLLAIFDPEGPKMLHVFDSFEGLTHFHDSDTTAQSQRGNYHGSREHLESCARLADVFSSIVIHEGKIESTLPKFAIENREKRFSFVYCDTDLYLATATILENVWRLMSVGGLMVFDQWNMADFPGEGIAVNQFIDTIAGSFEMVKPSHTRQPTLALRRVL